MTILNLRNLPADADYVRVDRQTRWGNPFRSGRDGTRADAVAKYREHLWKQIEIGQVLEDDLADLHGKNLACWCAPALCHANVIEAAAKWAHDRREQGLDAATADAMIDFEANHTEIAEEIEARQDMVDDAYAQAAGTS
jgi:hypothetical protein